MALEDIQKTAIITPSGMFEFLRLPFGLRNAGNTFQCLMDQVLGDLPFCFVYVDNILIFSRELSSHIDNLHKVLLLCCQHGLTIGLPKCEFVQDRVSRTPHSLPPDVQPSPSTLPPSLLFLRCLTSPLYRGFWG